jgi:hypothetical protein
MIYYLTLSKQTKKGAFWGHFGPKTHFPLIRFWPILDMLIITVKRIEKMKKKIMLQFVRGQILLLLDYQHVWRP